MFNRIGNGDGDVLPFPEPKKNDGTYCHEQDGKLMIMQIRDGQEFVHIIENVREARFYARNVIHGLTNFINKYK